MNSRAICTDITLYIGHRFINDKHDVSELISISFHTRGERTKESTKMSRKVFDNRKVKESDIGLIRL